MCDERQDSACNFSGCLCHPGAFLHVKTTTIYACVGKLTGIARKTGPELATQTTRTSGADGRAGTSRSAGPDGIHRSCGTGAASWSVTLAYQDSLAGLQVHALPPWESFHQLLFER